MCGLEKPTEWKGGQAFCWEFYALVRDSSTTVRPLLMEYFGVVYHVMNQGQARLLTFRTFMVQIGESLAFEL